MGHIGWFLRRASVDPFAKFFYNCMGATLKNAPIFTKLDKKNFSESFVKLMVFLRVPSIQNFQPTNQVKSYRFWVAKSKSGAIFLIWQRVDFLEFFEYTHFKNNKRGARGGNWGKLLWQMLVLGHSITPPSFINFEKNAMSGHFSCVIPSTKNAGEIEKVCEKT